MFEKGKSGNPGGRPKGEGRLRDLARKHTEAAIKTLLEVMSSKKAAPSARAAAASAILDRGWGRPAQAITGPEGGPLQFEKVVREIVDPK